MKPPVSSPASVITAEGESALDNYGRLLRRPIALVLCLAMLALIGLAIHTTSSPPKLSQARAWAALTGAQDTSRSATITVWWVCLPVVLLVLHVGAALFGAGRAFDVVTPMTLSGINGVEARVERRSAERIQVLADGTAPSRHPHETAPI
jgi:ABC-type Fe3+-siderophore transport system permease subunit